MAGIVDKILAEILAEALRLRYLDPADADPFVVIAKRYQQIVSTGFAHADRGNMTTPVWQDRTSADANAVRLAAINLAGAALHLAIEGSTLFRYHPEAQQGEQEAAHVR